MIKCIKENSDVGEEKLQILNEENAVKVKLKQAIEYDIEPEDDDYEVDEDTAIQDIEFDTSSMADDLLEYMKEYSYNDEYKEVYNSVRKVTVDVEDEIEVNIELGINFEDDVLKDVFSNFISEIVLQDDQFNGFGLYSDSISHDEDVEDEYGNYVRTVDIPDEEWDVEYSYTVNTVGEQTIEITR